MPVSPRILRCFGDRILGPKCCSSLCRAKLGPPGCQPFSWPLTRSLSVHPGPSRRCRIQADRLRPRSRLTEGRRLARFLQDRRRAPHGRLRRRRGLQLSVPYCSLSSIAREDHARLPSIPSLTQDISADFSENLYKRLDLRSFFSPERTRIAPRPSNGCVGLGLYEPS
jgi:hypothetical protein